MSINLIKPTLEYSSDIMKYRQEFLDSGESMSGCGSLRGCTTAKEWIDQLELISNKLTCPKDRINSTTYLAVREEDNKIVGVIDFRHDTTHEIVRTWGGNIGYSVRPDERKKGYATQMLKKVLDKCREYGLDKALVTCDFDNEASKRTIESNGGVFENNIELEGRAINRYFIKL